MILDITIPLVLQYAQLNKWYRTKDMLLYSDCWVPRHYHTTYGLHYAEIDNVLTALNLLTNGTVPEKRQRLRVNITLLDEAA